MKLKLLLGLSIALNLVLGAILVTGIRELQTSQPIPLPGGSLAADSNAAPALSPQERPARKTVEPGDWIQALRQAGVPAKVIADAAAADFEDRRQKRSWENQRKFDRGEIDNDTLTRFDLDHDAALEKELRAALGDEAFRRWDQGRVLAEFDRGGLTLAANENDELYDLRKTLDRKRLELDYARHDGKMDPDEASARMAALDAQYNEQLLKLLGDDRYVQLQTGGDPALGELRRGLRSMKANDAQMAGMEAAEQSWNTQRGKLELQMHKGQLSGEEFEKQMKALETDRDREYQKTLGADGFAEFLKTQDPQFQAMRQSGAGWGLTDNDINGLYAAVQKYESDVRDYRDRAQAIEAQGQPVDWAAVEKTLKDFSQQTENALRASLGDKFDKLKRSNVTPFER